jgi:hypothetical protein
VASYSPNNLPLRDMFRPQADCLDREGIRIDETIPLPGGGASVAVALGDGDHEYASYGRSAEKPEGRIEAPSWLSAATISKLANNPLLPRPRRTGVSQPIIIRRAEMVRPCNRLANPLAALALLTLIILR